MLIQSRTDRLGVAAIAALVTLALVVAGAADPQREGKSPSKGQQSDGARLAILRGRVTDEAGAPLADVRVRVAIPAADMRFVDPSTHHDQREARTDARGDYRLEFPGIAKPTTISIDAMKPGYRRLVGTLMAGGDPRSVEVAPGAAAEASLKLKPALYSAGIVVDEQGKPIPGVEIAANLAFGDRGSAGIERTASRPDGSFELFNYPAKAPAVRNATTKGVVYLTHPNYIAREIEDIYVLDGKQREVLRIVLGTGRKLTGTVLDVAGKPVPNAMIKVIRKDGTHRKATSTDANGKFALRGLSDGLTVFSARALKIRQKLNMPMAVNGDKLDLDVRLRTIPLPAGLKTHVVLGMQLTDVTAELKATYDLFNERGALILDPGKDSDRLEVGRLAEGYTFWMVGNKRIGSVREFVDQILAETAGRDADAYVRVVYTFSRVDFDGTRTARLRLTKDDLEQLQVVSDQLTPESE